MQTQTFSILDMHCSACVMRLEALEDEIPGIQSITASYKQQKLHVEYDEALISEVEIITAVRRLGYSPMVIPDEK